MQTNDPNNKRCAKQWFDNVKFLNVQFTNRVQCPYSVQFTRISFEDVQRVQMLRAHITSN